MTTTSRVSYIEERPLASLKEVILSAIFVFSGFLLSLYTYVPAFLLIIPLSFFMLFFREWKMIKNLKELKNKGVLSYEPKYRKNKAEANRVLTVVLLVIVGPMVLSAFLPPLPWISSTMAFVMAWPLSNVLEFALQKWTERKAGGRVVKYYKWVEYGEEVLLKEYGWKIKKEK
jgi:membrane protease YdiL (CAAX protease family)